MFKYVILLAALLVVALAEPKAEPKPGFIGGLPVVGAPAVAYNSLPYYGSYGPYGSYGYPHGYHGYPGYVAPSYYSGYNNGYYPYNNWW